jgi:hypothetical protein
VRYIHSLKVLVRSEEQHLSIISDIGFGSFETLNTILESSISRVHLEWFIWSNDWLLPSSIVDIVVNIENIVSGDSSKHILMLFAWLFLQLFSLNES